MRRDLEKEIVVNTMNKQGKINGGQRDISKAHDILSIQM
jgi:hypothetical protein